MSPFYKWSMETIRTLFGREIGQYWVDLEAWETILNENPQFEAIVEFGTYEGGMSWFLSAQARARNINFYTFDNKSPRLFCPHFYFVDILKSPHDILTMIPIDKPLILLTDNGNKVMEVTLYEKHLNEQSCIAVHDWGTEFMSSDIPEDWRMTLETDHTIFLMRNSFLNEREANNVLSNRQS